MEHLRHFYNDNIYIPENIREYMRNKKALFFDIETTGLDPDRSAVILIGASYVEGDNYVIEQFFAEGIREESIILEEFAKLLKSFNLVVTYNGKNFDVPFVNRRMERCGIEYRMDHEHLDLINHVRPNKALLGLTSCSLKNVEKSLNIAREDTIDGGESIGLYYEYLKTRDTSIRDKVLLHNFEDVYNLPKILKIFDRVEYVEVQDRLTSKQKSFLKSLLKRQELDLDRSIDSLTKKEASGLIDHLLKGTRCDYEKYILR